MSNTLYYARSLYFALNESSSTHTAIHANDVAFWFDYDSSSTVNSEIHFYYFP